MKWLLEIFVTAALNSSECPNYDAGQIGCVSRFGNRVAPRFVSISALGKPRNIAVRRVLLASIRVPAWFARCALCVNAELCISTARFEIRVYPMSLTGLCCSERSPTQQLRTPLRTTSCETKKASIVLLPKVDTDAEFAVIT